MFLLCKRYQVSITYNDLDLMIVLYCCRDINARMPGHSDNHLRTIDKRPLSVLFWHPAQKFEDMLNTYMGIYTISEHN